MRAVLPLCFLIAHCAPVPLVEERRAPPGLYARTAGPVFERRCAAPPCHGNSNRALQLYAPGFYRRDATRLHRDEPLSIEEQNSNEQHALAFLSDAHNALDTLLLAKPLARTTHLGGTVFTSSEESDCEAILQWIRSTGLP